VPVSAVILDSSGTSGNVMVLANNAVTTIPVQISGIGTTQVAISQGVAVGDLVVVADTAEALPSSLNGIARALTGGGGAVTRGTGVYVGNGGGGGGAFPGGGQTGG